MPTRYRGTPREVRALDAWITLARARDSVGNTLNRRLADAALTETQFGVLEALLHLGPLVQRDLARKLLTSPGNLVTVLDNLERRGMVRRERRTDDRRAVDVRLTPEGRRRIESLFPGHARAVTEAFSVLGAGEQATLKRLCRKLGLAQAGLREGRARD